MLINEKVIKESAVVEIGKKMMLAARTAPKSKGIDHLEAVLVTGDDLHVLADAMEESVNRHGQMFFIRDAGNIRVSQAVVVLGTKAPAMGMNCGYCGFETCEAKNKADASIPCAFPINDLGIAIGSACAMAADSRVDSRVMYSAGVTAMQLGWLGPEVTAAYAIPLSATGKSPFFDRKSTRPEESGK